MSEVDVEALATLSLDEIEETLQKLVDDRKYNKLQYFVPYQKQLHFIAQGKVKKQRLLTAGNQMGKSEIGAYEWAVHLTGLYPRDWPGHKWDHPVDLWAAGVTSETSRDIIQTKLCGVAGVAEALGTGFIPRHCFVDKPTLARHSVANAYESARIWHHDKHGRRDGVSTLGLKSYNQGREKLQGPTRHGIWWDEEPPGDIYVEGEARYSAIPDGRSIMTFTPTLGYTDVVKVFFSDIDPASTRGLITIGARDVVEAGLWTQEQLEENLRKYPVHEREARMNGVPTLGAGRIFLTDEALVAFPVDQVIPPHWALLWGIDFGFDHPFAAVLAAIDREADIIYFIGTYRAAEAFPVMHAEAIRRIAAQVPVAWPHDGGRRDSTGDGTPIAKLYKGLDLKMLHESARWPDGSKSTEAAVLEMQQRFADGRLRVREDLADFFEEYRRYHRELTRDGHSLIVKKNDDLISCAQKIMMMKRYAKSVPMGWTARPVKRSREDLRARAASVKVNPWTGQEDRPSWR